MANNSAGRFRVEADDNGDGRHRIVDTAANDVVEVGYPLRSLADEVVRVMNDYFPRLAACAVRDSAHAADLQNRYERLCDDHEALVSDMCRANKRIQELEYQVGLARTDDE